MRGSYVLVPYPYKGQRCRDWALRTSLAEILDAAPEYTDLNVIADLVP